MAGRAEENAVAGGAPGGGMGGKIVSAEISFHFNNACSQQIAALLADNQFSQEFRADLTRITIKE
jgi:hypothetical protein